MLRDRNFRIFWIAQTISWLGGWTQSVAQGWLVWSLTKSPAQLALTAIMVSTPALLFALPGGIAADKTDCRRLLVVTQAASIVPALLLGILTACGAITAPRVMLLAFLQGTLNAFDVPARHCFVADLVPRDRLRQAVVLNSLSFNATRMLGPALAGLAIAGFGSAPCFFLNAISFLLAALLLLALPRRSRSDAGTAMPSPSLVDLKEGWRFVLKDREVAFTLLQVALVSLFGIPFVPLLPVFAETLHLGAPGLGLLSACAGGGSLLAAVILAVSGEARDKSCGAGAGLVFAMALLLFSRSGDSRISMMALSLAGGGLVIFLAHANAFMQQRCPDRLRGRVMGAYALALAGMAPLGSAVMGCLAARLGAPQAVSVSASVCLFSLLLISFRRPRRRSWPFRFSLRAIIVNVSR